MNKKTYLSTAATIFLIVATLHLLRVIYKLEVVVGGWVVPQWLSVLAVVFIGYMSYQAFENLKNKLWKQ